MVTLQDHFAASSSTLDILTTPSRKATFARRDAVLDPLLIAAAVASGPDVTRNHYLHHFFPSPILPTPEPFLGSVKPEHKHLPHVSRQAPHRQRLPKGNDALEHDVGASVVVGNIPPITKKRRPSVIAPPTVEVRSEPMVHPLNEPITGPDQLPPAAEVKCMARTRIPTPHGPAFLHLYHNNRDSKEHLAIVIDSAQFSESSAPILAPPIRSQTLDAVWEGETEMDRITRGAYVGRLSSTSHHASDPPSHHPDAHSFTAHIPAPLIRVHSECFTGETVGSMRCDCGEQLDEAIRLISQPITIPATSPHESPTTIPGRGAVIYLRQEGRGIGLLSKLRAYNLQDLGHDTVTANLMLGHQADERGYEIAGAILRDLGLGVDTTSGVNEGVRVLTNNPDKVDALQKEGLKIVDRMSMIPRSWRNRHQQVGTENLLSPPTIVKEEGIAGSTLSGGNAVHGDDLDKYLRTKIVRMGHLLPLWMDEHETR